MTKLIVAFLQFVNAPKNLSHELSVVQAIWPRNALYFSVLLFAARTDGTTLKLCQVSEFLGPLLTKRYFSPLDCDVGLCHKMNRICFTTNRAYMICYICRPVDMIVHKLTLF